MDTVEIDDTRVQPAWVDDLWLAALADTGIDAEDALLLTIPGEQSKNGYSGKTWSRGSLIDELEDCEALGERLAAANSDEGRAVRRVALWIDQSSEGAAAILRHELEHAVQLDLDGQALQDLHDRALDVLIRLAGGLAGSGSLYNVIPMEADANAAAATFVRSRFGHERIDSLLQVGDKHAALFRLREGPKPVDSLRVRMERFVSVDGPRLARDFADRNGRSAGPANP